MNIDPSTPTPKTACIFCDICEEMQHDQNVRVAILTGAGSAFSSGGNVKRMAEAGEERRTNPIGTRGYYRKGIQRLPLALEKLDVPIIAAVWCDDPTRIMAVNVPNRGYLPDVTDGAIVEVGATVKRFKKPTFTKPAPVDLRHEIATQCTLVIEALAD